MAAPLTAQINGAEVVQKAIKNAPRQLGLGVERAMPIAGEVVRAKAQNNLSGPILDVKTGDLRASVGVQTTRSSLQSLVTIGTVKIHGAVHEFGSARNKAVAWLRRSFTASFDNIAKVFVLQITAAVRKINKGPAG